jgi:hypothetical protein
MIDFIRRSALGSRSLCDARPEYFFRRINIHRKAFSLSYFQFRQNGIHAGRRQPKWPREARRAAFRMDKTAPCASGRAARICFFRKNIPLIFNSA